MNAQSYLLARALAILRRCGLVAAIALLTWLPSESQLQPRSVTGVVTDKRGNALPGAAVQLENTVNLSVRSFITRKDGSYFFTGLNSEIDYTLKAKYRNYWSQPKTLSKFNESRHPVVNLMIPIE
ncbi:MAG TPA: carboxypeptidase-like regulatory domain-containing protein [Bryobacteraceae bacterium]|nr:carboxypeptidase-like regulatory domain-containing protein [Bryobacteraceae bacterium]